MARHATLRTLLAVCTAEDQSILQLGIETAFLNGDLVEEIYIQQPRGCKSEVCRLIKALPGLKQAARAWYQKLTAMLDAAGVTPCTADPCLLKGVIAGLLYLSSSTSTTS